MSWKILLGISLLALPLFAALSPGVSEGRHGNDLLDAGNEAAADSVYTDMLSSGELKPWLRARLQNNRGIARARTDRFGMADSAFVHSLSLEANPGLRAEIAYNAGTAALQANRFEDAVTHLRRALLLALGDSLTTRNIEIALRRSEPGADQEDSSKSPEASAFAQRIKAEADSLVRERRYLDALDVMRTGAARDSTVHAFQEFTGRLEGVVQIDTAETEPGK